MTEVSYKRYLFLGRLFTNLKINEANIEGEYRVRNKGFIEILVNYFSR